MMKLEIPRAVQWQDANGKIHLKPGGSAGLPGALDILDETLLPEKTLRLSLTAPEEIYEAIQKLRVRGAPAIGCAAALGLAACAQRFPRGSREDFRKRLQQTAEYLDSSRPTAVNLHWAMQRLLTAATSDTVPGLCQQLLDEALTILAEDIEMCRAIGENGAVLLKPGFGVLTHCNAGALATGGCGTALAPIYTAFAAGISLHVYSDETRPLLQGARLTAWELAAAGIPVTTICDSMAAQVMREGKIQLVIVGADRVAANGDAANKIGTYQLAIAASYHKIPFYIALPFSTIDAALADGDGIPIEQRSAGEIFHCRGAEVYNPAFDVTPHELITGYITERGLLSAADLLKL